MIKYTYLDKFGLPKSMTFGDNRITYALRVVAKHQESGSSRPVELFYNNKRYDYQSLMMMCHKYGYL
jgi:hypothetical protein